MHQKVGISSLIAYLINKHPYSIHSIEGQPPTAAAAWYKKCCIALQRCGVEEAELIINESNLLLQKREMDGPVQGSQSELKKQDLMPVLVKFERLPVSTIVLVVDSSRQKMDQLERLKESFSKIHQLITSNGSCFNRVEPNILVLAHKQDIIDCISVKEISDALNLEDERYKSINWAILPTSTKIPGSIDEALDWIVTFSYKFDSTRVEKKERVMCGGGCVVA